MASLQNAHCEGNATGPLCQVATGTCVECTVQTEAEGAYCVPMRFSPEGEEVAELGAIV